MIQTAVLGYGTVGSGVVKVIETNHDSIEKSTYWISEIFRGIRFRKKSYTTLT